MNNKKILVAFNSPTVREILVSHLREGNYDVIEAEDGVTALEAVMEQEPDCVLIYTELPVIQGYAISRIIKNTPALSSTAVILCSTDDTSVHHFWGTNSKCDGFYVPNSSNIHILYNLINKAIEKNAGNKKLSSIQKEKKNLYEIITSAYDMELFDLYIIKNAYQTSNYVFSIDDILEMMAKTLSGIYNYDALGIIINRHNLVEYYDHSDCLTQADFNDFRRVCQSDFEKRNSTRQKINWKNSVYTENIIESFSEKNEKLKSYEFFPPEEEASFPLTVHLASCHNNAFNSRTISRLNYFTQVYGILIEKALLFQNAIEAEKKMKEAFARFIPKKIIDDIITDSSSERVSIGEKRKVAILIADIRNFTKLSESNEPEKVVEFLNSYFSHMGAIIKKYGGTIDKFMGDAIMALFGAPESYTYNASRAANAALEMIKELDKIDSGLLKIPEGDRIHIGIGIHYGKPIVGAIGSEEKKDYTVIGDDVNLASRVESLTKYYGTSIIITDEVRRDIEASMKDSSAAPEEQILPHIIRHLDNVRVKGKSKATHIYELNGDRQKYDREFMNNYEKALHQYFQKNFHTASEYFLKAQNTNPMDKACFVMIERCHAYQKELPYDWDGAYTLSSK